MLWICRDCGNEVAANDAVLATTIGWTGLDGDTGVCPVCSEPRTAGLSPRAAEAAIRRARTDRAIEISRAMRRRLELSRREAPILDESAARLGFTRIPCFACQETGDPHCPNCEGVGDVWRNGSTTVSRFGLLRVAMRPPGRSTR
jgi:hypothetical protein